jgi:LPS export ABC transporter permease LptF
MAVSLEVRPPLLDHTLVAWGMALPAVLKLRGTTGKAILRDALAPLLPPDVLTRPKQGFAAPMVPLAAFAQLALEGAALDATTQRFAATLVVVLTIVLTMMLSRTLGQAAKGVASAQDVVLLLGFAAMAHLPTMVSLSLFVAVVLTLGRMYRDSEMVVWFSSGISLARVARPVLGSAWPALVIVALLITLAWPWVNRQTLEVRERFERRSDVARVAPGLFQTSSDGQRVFFIDRDSAESREARNVFILAQSRGVESITTALSGTVVNEGGDRFVVLDRGQRLGGLLARLELPGRVAG